MPVPITDWLFRDYLNCKHKAFLKLSGKSGVKSDYDKYQDENHTEYCQRAQEHLLIAGGYTTPPAVNSTFKEINKQSLSFAVGISVSNDKYSLILDAAELASQSSPRKPLYNPIIFLPHQKISKQHKLLLAFYGSALGHEQKIEPASGRIIFGNDLSSTRLQIASLFKTVGKIEKEITNMIDKQIAPPLRLNDHCKICEFQEICYAAAKEKDDLSLLRGLSEKEFDQLIKRGIFTITQYSYTFHPRRVNKMASRQILKHCYSLNALAIRTQTIYVAGKPELPAAATRVYLDVEGIPDENFYYLIGLVIDDGKSVSSHSFWAKNKSKENTIWLSFLEKMETLKDFVLFHYGSYETKFLKLMGAQYGGSSELLEKITSHSFNVLSAIYGKIYFPTYSNDLKSVASFLGLKWSDRNASGLTSLLWRRQWETSDNDLFKQKLITYNYEDCQALRKVANYLSDIALDDHAIKYPTMHTDQLRREKPHDIFRPNEFCFPELEKINRCSYFDYQRDKVYLRSNPLAKRRLARMHKKQQMTLRVNKVIYCRLLMKCPHCSSRELLKYGSISRTIYDLKIITGGIKRWVVRYKATRFLCKNCRKASSSTRYRKLSSEKYGHTLISWAVYQNIGRLKSMRTIAEDFGEIFGYWFPSKVAFNFKMRAANYYRGAYKSLANKIIRGNVIHVDETKVNLKEGIGYIWAFANSEEAIYIYTPTREGKILKDVLNDYDGILVSDFYSAYDSLPCRQQKCLIHLIRDINDDISKNPFDEEMKELGRDFTKLLVPIIETIDKYGLKKRHLNKHKIEALRFFDKMELKNYTSESANGFQKRFAKYKDKLFTFLDYDGVPWNNNNAEHAIKRFVSIRRVIGGSSTAKGIQEYLVLLSICETMRLRNASFFRFLLSRETNIDKFLERKKGRLA